MSLAESLKGLAQAPVFRRGQETLLGIDVSSTAIKLLELARHGSGYRVESYAVEPLPPKAVVEKNIAEVEAVGEAIRKAVRRAGTRTRGCVLAVPSSAVITKVLPMPASLSDEEMEGQIELEADQYIPYALEEVNLDFEVLGPSENNPEAADVLIAASRSENVDIRLAAADIAGLTARVVDVEAYAVEHAFNLMADQSDEGLRESLVAILDVGATMTSINVMEEGQLIYTREQPFGGKQLTEEIMRRYNLSYEEAGLAKKEGGLPGSYVPEVLEPFKETMAQQAHRFLQFFFASSQRSAVDYLFVGGGCASIAGVDELIEHRLGAPTRVANPFMQMSVSPRVNGQRLAADAPAMLIAAGLAARGLG